jgi:hypothetical protein
MFFWVQHDKGEYKAFCTGGVLSNWRTLEWKLRMKVCFHHKFIVNEWMESTIKMTHPIYLQPLLAKNTDLMYCLRVSPIELIDPLKVQQSYNCGLWATESPVPWDESTKQQACSYLRITWRFTHQEKTTEWMRRNWETLNKKGFLVNHSRHPQQ